MIFNPKAKAANIILAAIYIVVLASLFAGALCWQLLRG